MNFKPIDEISMRHLFSTAYAQEVLHFSYICPVLNDAGAIETSPNAMVLDMRKSPFRPLRCEFKFSPASKEDFAHNGHFDIAIIWSLQQGWTRERLLQDLLMQNECSEVIVLSYIKAFRDLPVYSIDALSRLGGTDEIRKRALNSEFSSVCVLYIAAKIYPDKFQINNMVNFLVKRFPEIKKMKPQGRANIVSAFIQTKPPLLNRMHGNFYRWSSEFDSIIAVGELSELITSRFGETLPSDDDFNYVQ